MIEAYIISLIYLIHCTRTIWLNWYRSTNKGWTPHDKWLFTITRKVIIRNRQRREGE